MRKSWCTGVFAVSIAAASPVLAQSEIRGIGTWPAYSRGVSADGSTVVGVTYDGGTGAAFRWTWDSGLQVLGPDSDAYATSADGKYITGTMRFVFHEGFQVFRHTTDAGFENLGHPPGTSWGGGAAISADGTIVAGSAAGASYPAFRWTTESGMQSLDGISGLKFSGATGMSADGRIVVGTGEDADQTGHGRRWDAATGTSELPRLQDSLTEYVFGISPNGATITGATEFAAGNNWKPSHAVIWTSDGIHDITTGPFATEPWYTYAIAASDTGVVVGWSAQTATGYRAIIWTAEHGMRNLQEVLETDYGMDLRGWCLQQAWAISADGTVITGGGFDPNGEQQPWVVRLGSPDAGGCRADFDKSGFVDTDDFDAFIHAFEDGSKLADFDESCFTDTDDFDAFVHAFVDGC